MSVKKRRQADASGKIQWHPGFYGAAELELRANAAELSFRTELELSKKPLIADLLVVEAKPGVRIENEIGRIFRGYNLFEYKSPKDRLSIDDFFKAIGYACLYKGLGESVNRYPEEEITVSLFRDTYPRELFKELKLSGREVREKYHGIYYVTGRLPFDAQVVVTSRLDAEGHSALRVLSEHVRMDDVRRFIKETGRYTTPGDIENAEAVLQVSMSANAALYDEVRRDTVMYDAIEYFLRDSIEKAKLEGEQNVTQRDIRSLMSTLSVTAEQAMDALQIPPSERQMYLDKLQQV